MHMTGLRWPARLYWAGVILAAVGLFAFTAVYSPFADGQHLVPILVFTGLVTLAKRFPLHFALQTKLTLDTTVLFAAILLFDPASAMALAGIGTLLAQTIGRGGWVQTPFNSAQAVLKVGVGALLLAGGAGMSSNSPLIIPNGCSCLWSPPGRCMSSTPWSSR
jgi:hypothetical protein